MEEGEGTHGSERTVGGEKSQQTNVRVTTLKGKGTRGTTSKQGSQKRKRKILQSKSKTKGKGLQLVDEEPEFEDPLSSDDEEDDKAIKYDDDSMKDSLSDDTNDGGDDDGFDPFFRPLDTNDTLLI